MVGNIILKEGDCINLIPQLAEGCYGIRFNSNDGTGRVYLMCLRHGVETRIPLIEQGFGWRRQGYSFCGWSVNPAGKIAYMDGGIACRRTTIGNIFDVFAIWKPINFQFVEALWREPVFKIGGLKRIAHEVKELCLGSSHAHYGYYATESSYNLADPSCDAYYSFHMLKYWAGRLPVLSRIVYFYDVFNRGNVIDRGRDGFRRIPWLHFYGMRPQVDEVRRNTNIGESYSACEAVFLKVVDEHLHAIPPDYRGNAIKRQPMPNVDLKARVAMHLKLSNGDSDRYVSEMIDFCRAKNLKLTIVIPPLRSDYMRELPPGFKLRPPEGARVIDFMGSGLFVDEDFIDCDHLTEDGAKKLTRILHNKMYIGEDAELSRS